MFNMRNKKKTVVLIKYVQEKSATNTLLFSTITTLIVG